MITTDLSSGIQTSRTTWHTEQAVAGHEDRKINLAVFNGEIQYASGERGVYAGVEAIEISDATEPFSGTIVVLLRDGSVSHQAFEGIVTLRASTRRLSGVGKWEYLTGTGRFCELRGGGALTWTLEDGEWRAEFTGEETPE